jgi:hypothetical protein
MGNEFTNSEIRFTVICQATQANGNSDSPLTAWGWPSEGNAPDNGIENGSADQNNTPEQDDASGDKTN